VISLAIVRETAIIRDYDNNCAAEKGRGSGVHADGKRRAYGAEREPAQCVGRGTGTGCGWCPMRPSLVPALVIGILAVAFAVYCLVDLVRAKRVRYLPKLIWGVIICVSVPWGGLIYLLIGKDREAAGAELEAEVKTEVKRMPGRRARDQVSQVEITVDRLTKRFGQVLAVDDLSFTVHPGRVTGFLGPNGAGKTTTMRVILGLDAPTSGKALVGGRRYAEIVRPLNQVGALLDAEAVHGGRTAWFHLLAIARSNGIGRDRVTEVLELTGLETVAGRRAGGFSLGMKQRLGIAAALLADPAVLIFDEPANGLDPDGMRWIRQLFSAMAAEGRTILVSSHLMSEMAMIADHLVIIGKGRLLADTSTEDFIEANARRDVFVRSPRAAELGDLIRAQGGTVGEADNGLTVTGLESAAIGELAAGHGISLHELVPRRASLETAYLDLTGGSTEYPAGSQAVPGLTYEGSTV